jgi:hypothetical protein
MFHAAMWANLIIRPTVRILKARVKAHFGSARCAGAWGFGESQALRLRSFAFDAAQNGIQEKAVA